MLTLNVRSTVHDAIITLLGETDDDVDAITDDEQLIHLGLNSLTLARLVITLESEFGTDPFSNGASMTDIRTVSDLIGTYERALRPDGEV